MKIYNSIEYTVPSERHGGARYHLITALVRPYRLTYRGAERILRRETGHADLVVARIEYATYAR